MRLLPKRKRRYSPILTIEDLEVRTLLSAITADLTVAPETESEPNDTLDRAQDLGSSGDVAVTGSIDPNGTDVDWYSFTLLVASEVTLTSSNGTISLYNDAARDFGDRLNPLGNRQLAQSSSTDQSAATLTRSLAAGTYYVAVSGNGNLDFNPFLANSGMRGTSGDYELDVNSSALPDNGLTSLATDVSAVGIRLDLNQALDFAPVVTLTDSSGNDVSLAWTDYDANLAELRFAPAVALTPGAYTVTVRDGSGITHLTTSVQLSADAGGVATDLGNDTPATAIELGDIDDLGNIQIAGIIGDDPYYNASSFDPALNPGNDVDLYHFTITSDTPVGLQADAFAGRIGSPLDAGLSLYRLDPATGHLVFVAGNNQSYNPITGTNGLSPLYYDPHLITGLTSGDYYIAVSHGFNTRSPLELQPIGSDASGIFDPEQAHSGTAGLNVGPYVLDLRVVPVNSSAPQVTGVSIANGTNLTAPTTSFSVQFNQYVDLTSLAFAAWQSSSHGGMDGVYIQNSLGQKFYPRLTDFDPQTFTAQFMMLDRLPVGAYELHLSGNHGVTNVFGQALAGNTPEGDFVVPFNVIAASIGDPTVWTHDPATDASGAVQPLGTLFPTELAAGVSIVRAAHGGGQSSSDTSDSYSFQILQSQSYLIALTGKKLPAGISLQLFDQQGHLVNTATAGDGLSILAQLSPGQYVLKIGDWPTSSAKSLNYQVSLNLLGRGDNPPPLFSGPAPAVGIRLATAVDLGSGGSSTPPVNTGGGSGGGVSGGFGGGFGGSTGQGSGSSGGGSSLASTGSSPNGISNFNSQFMPRITLPDGAGGIVVAIPTQSSLSGDGVRFQAARSIRRAADFRDSLTPGSLSELADGPEGVEKPAKDEAANKPNLIQKLRELIQQAISAKRKTDDQATPANAPADRPANSEEAPATEKTTQSPDANAPRTGASEKGEGEQESRNTGWLEFESTRYIAAVDAVNDSAFLPSDDSDDVLSFGAATVTTENDPTRISLVPSQDLVIAGLGVLAINSALRNTDPENAKFARKRTRQLQN